ncbi:hypothetical protein J2Z22_003250 [Paenibacillus forsythiae]|uniref:Bacteriophage SP-beta YorD domain-containing protein n=1 Tax=Paenibacillus forsythiae TaxID=365616 RepID=A0ABU3HA36_9BACL|nr:XkdW family protein [Paenibacillus forsythiae]MDT3427687.1 hypothetical protein [Paenibacillus forsythiae]
MNISRAIQYLYPDVDVMRDFEVWDNADDKGPYIAVWNLEAPEPTEEELQAAWEAYQAAEAAKEPELTEVDRLELALADNYEQMLAAQQDAANAQLALADLYELTLSLQAEVEALKGGAS